MEPRLNRMRGYSGTITLEPRTMRVLVELVRARPAVLSRDELMERVWEDSVVTEHSLTIAISDLRSVLGDDPRAPSFIETIRGVGYRLIAPVSVVGQDGGAPSEIITPSLSVPVEGDGLPMMEVSAGLVQPEVFTWRNSIKTWMLAVAVLVLLVSSLLMWRASKNHTIEIHRIQPLTSMAGVETSPVFSPDGRRIAYVSFPDSGDVSRIYVQQLGAGAPVAFTSERGAELMPAWSPDGQYIVYLHYGSDGCALHKKPSFGGASLKLMDIDCRLSGLSWSTDGQTLALSMYDAASNNRRLYLLDLDRLELSPLTSPPASYTGDALPRFAPDGSTLAFMRVMDGNSKDIFLLDTDGSSQPVQLTLDGVNITGFDWASDGKSIVFASNRNQQFGLWQIPVDGSHPSRLIRAVSMEDPGSVAISRTGKALIYTDWTFEINTWRIGPGSSGEPAQVVASTRSDFQPALSINQKLAFISSRTGVNEVWIAEGDGQDPVKLTDLQSHSTGYPAWSPDGKQLAFSSRVDGQQDIFVIDAAGGVPRRITDAVSQESRPSWSADGSALYYSSDRGGSWQIWKQLIEGGEPEQVTAQGGSAAWEDRNGNVLYYFRPDTTGIWKKALPAGEEVRILDADPTYLSITDAGIFYLNPSNQAVAFDVMRFDVVADTSYQVLDIPVRPLHYFNRWGFAVSLAGDYIYFSQVDHSESDLMLTEGSL